MTTDILRLDGRTALVTGGSRGIGQTIVRDLVAQGVNVAFTYVSSEAAAKSLEAELSASGRVKAYRSDVSDVTAIERLKAEIHTDLGRIDILVNNAAAFVAKPFAEVSEDEFDQVFGTNVKGPYFLVQHLAALMSEGARVINLSSGATKVHVPFTSLYAASKGAVEQFTRLWAKELAERQITVNSVLPGYTQTDWMADLPSDQKHWMAEQADFKRLGSAEDVSRVVLFLASDMGRWVTGQQISADGGL